MPHLSFAKSHPPDLAAKRDPGPVAPEVVEEQSGKSQVAQNACASFAKFQAQLAGRGRIAEGAYHRL